MTRNQSRNGPSADTQPSTDGGLSARRRLSVQDVATRHRVSPRKLLRTIDVALSEHGKPKRGGFDVVMSEIGVRAQRSADASRTTYSVFDDRLLMDWFLSGETLKLESSEVQDLLNVLEALRKRTALTIEPHKRPSSELLKAADRWRRLLSLALPQPENQPVTPISQRRGP